MGVCGADSRVDGRGQMSMNRSVSECVCVCGASSPFFAAWRRSIPAVSVGGSLLIVRTVCGHNTAHALSAFNGNGWERNQQRGAPPDKTVNFTSAALKIDDVGPGFSGSKEQVALRGSLHLGEIWRMEWHCSWSPDSSFELDFGCSFTNVRRRTSVKVLTCFQCHLL